MSSNDTIITVDNVSKAYLLGVQQEEDTLFNSLINTVKAPLRNFRKLHRLNTFNLKEAPAEDTDDILWALKDISFEVTRGECLGIIGRNGAGKSTLLKILSRIAEPTRGRIEMKGRVSSLLEVGTGFHPELTGRENIYLNATILGMRRAEINAKFDEIVDFSGVEKFLDTPVKRYSSGMKVRLAFAVAAHLEPEILIVDEVLAVGDAEFQKKCLGKMQDVATGEGRTVLFVSHNMGAVQNLCPRAILLRGGAMVEDGESEEVVSNYMNAFMETADQAFAPDNPDRGGDGRVRITAARCINHRGEISNSLFAGKPATFDIEYENHAGLSSLTVMMTVINGNGVCVTHCNSQFSRERVQLEPGKGRIACNIEEIPFPMGRYRVAVVLKDASDKCDAIPNAIVFDVTESDFFPTGTTPQVRYCAAMVRHTWELGAPVNHELALG